MRPTLLPIKDPLETIAISFEFGDHIADGATLLSCKVTAVVMTGVPDPATIIQLQADLTHAPQVRQLVTAGISGNTYLLTAAASISTGETIVLKAVLPVGQ